MPLRAVRGLAFLLAAGACRTPVPAERGEPMPGTLAGDLVPAFEATVHRRVDAGFREEPFSSRAAGRPTVYVVSSTTCGFCADYAERVLRIEETYMPRGVDVVHIYPSRSESPAEKTAWHRERGFRGGQVLDADAAVARALDVDRTPTAVLVDAKGIILYRGAIDDEPSGRNVKAPYLADALDAHLSGRPVAVAWTEPYG